MVKIGERVLSIIMLLFAMFSTAAMLVPEMVSAKATQQTQVPALGNYSSPTWWQGSTCDKIHYPAAYQAAIWRGIQVCGPYSGSDTSHSDSFSENGAGAGQYEFQCTDLIARYIWARFGIKSQIADGGQIVDIYTGKVSNSPFNRVLNNGNVHITPVEGDVLSYAATAANSGHGHTAIVTGTNADGSINVIQQNIRWNGSYQPADTLKISGYIIQPSTKGAGSVVSWMTTRAVPTPTTTVNFSLSLTGIGTTAGLNNHPRHPGLVAAIQIRNGQNQNVYTTHTNVTYNSSTGLYSGSISFTVPAGSYLFLAKLPNTLNKQAYNFFQAGGTITEPTLLPLSGDVDSNNTIDIQDYNDLMNCYGARYASCVYKTTADLNDDGAVDGVDYNIIMRSFSGIH